MFLAANSGEVSRRYSKPTRRLSKNIKVFGMFQFIQKLNQAIVVSLDSRGDIDFHQAARIGLQLMQT